MPISFHFPLAIIVLNEVLWLVVMLSHSDLQVTI